MLKTILLIAAIIFVLFVIILMYGLCRLSSYYSRIEEELDYDRYN